MQLWVQDFHVKNVYDKRKTVDEKEICKYLIFLKTFWDSIISNNI